RIWNPGYPHPKEDGCNEEDGHARDPRSNVPVWPGTSRYCAHTSSTMRLIDNFVRNCMFKMGFAQSRFRSSLRAKWRNCVKGFNGCTTCRQSRPGGRLAYIDCFEARA